MCRTVRARSNPALPPKVSFDSTKHLSDASIKKRQLERQKLQELEQQREEQKRREKEAEERQRAEERCVLPGRPGSAGLCACAPVPGGGGDTPRECAACGPAPGHRRFPLCLPAEPPGAPCTTC